MNNECLTSNLFQSFIQNLFRNLVNSGNDKEVANDELSITNIVIIKPDAETSSALQGLYPELVSGSGK
jgi:hypothetical protein